MLFLLASAREGGNTEALACHAAAHLPPGVGKRWLRLSDIPLPPFKDIRHTCDGVYTAPAGNERLLLEATLEASDLVFASPLYWYSLSASAKLYLDHWSAWLRVPDIEFKARMRDKTLWAISAFSSDDPARADPLLATLRLSADYLGMRFGGALLSRCNRPADVLKDADALVRSQTFFNLPASLTEIGG